MRITWIGHSTVLIELDGVRLLTDPLLRKRVLHLRRVVDVDPGVASNLDAVLISHLHYDHLDLPSLRRLDRSCLVVVPRGGGRLLTRRGFRNVVEIERGESIAIGACTVEATHAEHDGNRGPLMARAAAIGFLVSGTGRVYFAGDTDLFDEMSGLGARSRRRDPARCRLGPETAAGAPRRAPSRAGARAPAPACRGAGALGDVPPDRPDPRPVRAERACRVVREARSRARAGRRRPRAGSRRQPRRVPAAG